MYILPQETEKASLILSRCCQMPSLLPLLGRAWESSCVAPTDDFRATSHRKNDRKLMISLPKCLSVPQSGIQLRIYGQDHPLSALGRTFYFLRSISFFFELKSAYIFTSLPPLSLPPLPERIAYLQAQKCPDELSYHNLNPQS